MRWLDIRLPLLVIAFKGLISTSNSLVRKQFSERVPRIAEEAGVQGLTSTLCTSTLCNALYATRSRWAHGSHIALQRTAKTAPAPDDEGAHTSNDEVDQVALLEQALRTVLRHCIEDGGFRASFQSEETVRERWPVRL